MVDAVVVVIVIIVIIKQKLLSIIPAATMLELPALLMPPNISFSLVLARKDWWDNSADCKVYFLYDAIDLQQDKECHPVPQERYFKGQCP